MSDLWTPAPKRVGPPPMTKTWIGGAEVAFPVEHQQNVELQVPGVQMPDGTTRPHPQAVMQLVAQNRVLVQALLREVTDLREMLKDLQGILYDGSFAFSPDEPDRAEDYRRALDEWDDELRARAQQPAPTAEVDSDP